MFLIGVVLGPVHLSGCDRVLAHCRKFVNQVRVLRADPKRILYYLNSAEELYCPVLRGPVVLHLELELKQIMAGIEQVFSSQSFLLGPEMSKLEERLAPN